MLCAGVLLAFGLPSPTLQAQVNDFGVGGVLDVPSARMEPENTFTATYSRKDVADIYAIAYQPFPQLETSFRYIISFPRNVPPVPGSFCDLDEAYCRNQLKDRSFEVKLRLLEESEYLPQVSVGLRDILGTGVFNGEYLVGSKQVGT